MLLEKEFNWLWLSKFIFRKCNGYSNNKKINLIKEILEIETHELIEKVLNLLKKEKKDFWDELTPKQKAEIEKADLEVLNEETTDYKTFMSSNGKRNVIISKTA
jgi:hypothetical protein